MELKFVGENISPTFLSKNLDYSIININFAKDFLTNKI
jgi:hypothetical protein